MSNLTDRLTAASISKQPVTLNHKEVSVLCEVIRKGSVAAEELLAIQVLVRQADRAATTARELAASVLKMAHLDVTKEPRDEPTPHPHPPSSEPIR